MEELPHGGCKCYESSDDMLTCYSFETERRTANYAKQSTDAPPLSGVTTAYTICNRGNGISFSLVYLHTTENGHDTNRSYSMLSKQRK
jgi:hypothetical protein